MRVLLPVSYWQGPLKSPVRAGFVRILSAVGPLPRSSVLLTLVPLLTAGNSDHKQSKSYVVLTDCVPTLSVVYPPTTSVPLLTTVVAMLARPPLRCLVPVLAQMKIVVRPMSIPLRVSTIYAPLTPQHCRRLCPGSVGRPFVWIKIVAKPYS